MQLECKTRIVVRCKQKNIVVASIDNPTADVYAFLRNFYIR